MNKEIHTNQSFVAPLQPLVFLKHVPSISAWIWSLVILSAGICVHFDFTWLWRPMYTVPACILHPGIVCWPAPVVLSGVVDPTSIDPVRSACPCYALLYW